MGKNVWIALVVIGCGLLAFGLSCLFLGIFVLWIFTISGTPLPPGTFWVFWWITYGLMLIGLILTIIGIILTVYGVVLYRREKEADRKQGLA